MNKFRIFTAFFVFVAIFASGCGLLSGERAKAKKISDAVELGADWKEIVPAAPLETNREIQFVGLKIENVKRGSETNPGKLLRNDGGELEIQVELVDKTGNSVKLFPIGVGQYVEFGTGNQLPADASYSKIRIKSSEKITVGEVVWGDSSQW